MYGGQASVNMRTKARLLKSRSSPQSPAHLNLLSNIAHDAAHMCTFLNKHAQGRETRPAFGFQHGIFDINSA